MSLFRKKKQDIERSEQNKGLIRQLFSQAMPDGDTWKIVYGYGLNIKTSDYIIARKTTYTYASLIIGYRESDMSIALLQTTPELEGCSEAEIFTRDSIKKAKISTGMYTIYHQGGIMAGYTQFATLPENDEDYLVYMYQPEEHEDFSRFYKRFSGKQSRFMKELLSYLFPFFVVCLILFVVTRIWIALVDTMIGWEKRLLHPEGGNKVSVKWHIARPAIPAEETEQMSECKEKSDAQSWSNGKDREDQALHKHIPGLQKQDGNSKSNSECFTSILP